MSDVARKSCVVAYATRERQFLWTVDLPAQATIADALQAARALATGVDVPWEAAPVGIFGELRQRDDRPAEGDRIELYRPLAADPRERRRERVRTQRRAARSSGR